MNMASAIGLEPGETGCLEATLVVALALALR